jgi:glycosyltransferase involved in cell wall biosynthesis
VSSSGRPVVAVYRRELLPRSETFIRNQAGALRRNVPVFVGQKREAGLRLPRCQVVIGMPGGPRRRALRHRFGRSDPYARMAKACRARGVDLIHAHFGPDGVQALPLARALRVPLVVTFHGFDATMSDDALIANGGGMADLVHRRDELFGEATLLLAVSGFIADELRKRGAPESKLRVHHNAVPLGPLPAPGEREPVVLFVGRDVEKKGLGDLVEAMAIVRRAVPDARLLVVGDGELRPEHERRATQLAVDARFLGWLPPEAVAEHVRSARTICVPSRRAANGDAEGLPMTVLEAAAQGVPVVATRHSGIPEAVVHGESGLLADEGDAEGIATQLTSVLTDEELWRRLSAGACDRIAREFDPGLQATKLEQLYDEALAVARPASILAADGTP